MTKQTTSKKLLEAITTDLLQLTKAEIYYKYSNKVDAISPETFKESLEYLHEAGIFSNMIDWHYEKKHNADDEYIFDSGRLNGYSDIYIVAYLSVNDGVSKEDVDKVLRVEESKDFAEKV